MPQLGGGVWSLWEGLIQRPTGEVARQGAAAQGHPAAGLAAQPTTSWLKALLHLEAQTNQLKALHRC